jgi:hypothetical protein
MVSTITKIKFLTDTCAEDLIVLESNSTTGESQPLYLEDYASSALSDSLIFVDGTEFITMHYSSRA